MTNKPTLVWNFITNKWDKFGDKIPWRLFWEFVAGSYKRVFSFPKKEPLEEEKVVNFIWKRVPSGTSYNLCLELANDLCQQFRRGEK